MSQPFDLILRGGRIVTPAGVVAADLAIAQGRIAAIGTGLGAARETLDATDRLVMPGGVDVHAHIEQRSGMGLMNADTFETATASAAMGGTTSVISFAAQAKGQNLHAAVHDYTARAARGARIDHAFHIMVTDTQVPDFATDLAALIAAGHRSVKVFTTYAIKLEDADILSILRIAGAAGGMVCVHAETDALIAEAKADLLARGMIAPRHHAASHPPMAEIEAVQRICRFAEATGTPTMVFHVSTARAADTLRGARRMSVPIWGETCPHYLLMGPEKLDAPGLDGAKWMCSPPQREAPDRAGLWAAIARGDLQVISSDHAPYRMDETGKLSAGPGARFDQIANGMPGLETRLPLIFDAMVSQGRGGAEAFARLTATAPAQIYGLAGKGALAPGFDADIVLWDPARTHVYGADDLHDNTGYNPWDGHRITGWPETVLRRGEVIVQAGRLNAHPGSGRAIARPRRITAP